MSSAVLKCMFRDVLIIHGILFIAIMSIASVMSPYISSSSLGTLIHVMLTCSVACLLVLTFTDPRFGPNMSSAFRMSCLVMLQHNCYTT